MHCVNCFEQLTKQGGVFSVVFFAINSKHFLNFFNYSVLGFICHIFYDKTIFVPLILLSFWQLVEVKSAQTISVSILVTANSLAAKERIKSNSLADRNPKSRLSSIGKWVFQTYGNSEIVQTVCRSSQFPHNFSLSYSEKRAIRHQFIKTHVEIDLY
jgi:hypothetical protein